MTSWWIPSNKQKNKPFHTYLGITYQEHIVHWYLAKLLLRMRISLSANLKLAVTLNPLGLNYHVIAPFVSLLKNLSLVDKKLKLCDDFFSFFLLVSKLLMQIWKINTPDADTLSFCPVFYNLHSLSLNIRLEKFFSSFLTWNKFLSISQRNGPSHDTASKGSKRG